LVNISYSDACVAPPGKTRYCIVLSNAWWISWLPKYTGVNRKGLHYLRLKFYY
jgi:hypothetical protein